MSSVSSLSFFFFFFFPVVALVLVPVDFCASTSRTDITGRTAASAASTGAPSRSIAPSAPTLAASAAALPGVLSHHGQPEFGAAVAPCCVESELLSMIDTVDSRMQIYRETMAEMAPGEFSKRIFALEKRIYRHD